MKVFFDLDDVLFDTGAFVAATGAIFERQGVPRDMFYDTYAQARLIGNETMKVYDFSAHVDILKRYVSDLNYERLRLEYDELFEDTSCYVFSDVVAVLKDLKQQGAQLFVVSFGSDTIQRAKIKGSGLMVFLDDFFIGMEAKSRVIGSVAGDDPVVWFIDDQPKFIEDVKTTLPCVMTIQMMRKDGRFVNERHPKSDFMAENMQEIRDFIGGYNM